MIEYKFGDEFDGDSYENEFETIGPVDSDLMWMRRAVSQAKLAAEADEVPVGALIVRGGQILGLAHNGREQLRDPTAHAEMLAITQAASSIEDWRLEGCTMYVTLEPCAMCAGAIAHARIRRLYYGASDPKGGAVEYGPRFFSQPTCHHRPDVYGGIGAREAGDLLRDFFAARR